MDGKLEISRLYDFYGALIPASQQQVVELYVNDDLSLSEVADILSISRQGVRDSLNRASKKLRDYDEQRDEHCLKAKIARENHRFTRQNRVGEQRQRNE